MFRFGFYALVFFVFSLPWQDIIRIPGGSTLSVSRIVGLILIAGGVGATLNRGVVRLRLPAVTILLTVVFALWAMASNLWNIWDPKLGIITSLAYLQLAVMSVLIWQLCRTKNDHMILLQAFVLGSGILAGRLVYDFLTNPFVANSQQSIERYTGFGGNPNGLAAIMALSLPIAWFLANFWSRGLFRWLNFIYLPAGILGIVLTASRGGFVIALVGLLVIPLTFRYLSRSSRFGVATFIVLAGALLYLLIPPGNFERLSQTSSEISEGNVSNRSQIWAAGLKLYPESPIIGTGTGSFIRAVRPILGYSMPAHNAWLLVLIEMGIIGFVLYVGNFIVVLIPLVRLPGPDKMLYLCLWSALVVSMLPSNVEDAQHVWALLTIMATRRAYVLRLPNRTLAREKNSSEVVFRGS